MSLKSTLQSSRKKRKLHYPVDAGNAGWAGLKPAKTKAEKIQQIKTEFIDKRALLIEGAKASDFAEYPHIKAQTSVQELIACIDAMSGKEGFYVVDGMDVASAEEQENFLPLLKDRQLGSSKLPDKVQILIPVKSTKSVNPYVRELTFPLKVS